MKERLKLILEGFVYGIVFTLLILNVYSWITKKPILSGARSVIAKLDSMDELIYSNYLHDYDYDKMDDALLAGYISGLEDPYSAYYTEEEYKQITENTEGKYTGIGVTIDPDGKDVKVIEFSENSPAEKAGMKEGDIITAVDGKPIDGLSRDEVVSMIKYSSGESVVITVKRGDKTQDINIVKETIETKTVDYEILDGDIGYLRLTEFTDSGTSQFSNAMEDMNSKGLKGLIMDLRGNPGGLLTSVCTIVDPFIDEDKLIVYTENKHELREEYKSKEPKTINVPLVVLINGQSASASEIFAGVIKDYGAGTLIGSKTYGKGVVQNMFKLDDGSAVKLTISSYYTPNGVNLDGNGIEPDIRVDDETTSDEISKDTKKDIAVKKALEVLNKK